MNSIVQWRTSGVSGNDKREPLATWKMWSDVGRISLFFTVKTCPVGSQCKLKKNNSHLEHTFITHIFLIESERALLAYVAYTYVVFVLVTKQLPVHRDNKYTDSKIEIKDVNNRQNI